MKNKNEKAYKQLLKKCLKNGFLQTTPKNVDTLTLTNQFLELDMKYIPIMTSKKMFYNLTVAEYQCYIDNKIDLNTFHEYKIRYWDKDAMNNNGSLGPIYGTQWHIKNSSGNSQWDQVNKYLAERDPSRRIFISNWQWQALPSMCLPPCVVSYQFNIRGEYLDLLVYQRSADAFLGVPFDILQNWYLAKKLADKHNYKLGKLSFAYGNFHIYTNHIKPVKKYLKNKMYKQITNIKDYKSCEVIKGELNV